MPPFTEIVRATRVEEQAPAPSPVRPLRGGLDVHPTHNGWFFTRRHSWQIAISASSYALTCELLRAQHRQTWQKCVVLPVGECPAEMPAIPALQ